MHIPPLWDKSVPEECFSRRVIGRDTVIARLGAARHCIREVMS
jgi:hypothetical protein